MFNENEKNCLNCKFFNRYYLKKEKGFKALLTGFCSNTLNNGSKRYKLNQVLAYHTCEFWQFEDGIKLKQSIKELLKNTCVKIEEIAQILNDDT